MGLLTYTNPTLTNPADRTEVQNNFADVSTLVNGGLDSSNFAAAAAITNAQLTNSHYEFLATFMFQAIDDGGAADIATMRHSTTAPSMVIPLPTTAAGDGAYTVLSGSWFCSDVGDETEDFTLTWGAYAAGAWSITQTLVAVANITGSGGANTPGQGTITFAQTALAASDATQRGLAINFPNAAAAGLMSTAGDFLSVSLKLRRDGGLRST